jgi:hypothetical protein
MGEVLYCIVCDRDTRCVFVRETAQCDRVYYWWRCTECDHEFSAEFGR